MTLATTAPNNFSDHNPFRQRLQVTPQPTGALNSPPAPSASNSASIARLEQRGQVENPFEQPPPSPSPVSAVNASVTVPSYDTTYQPPPSPSNTTSTSSLPPPPDFQSQPQSTTMTAPAPPAHPQSTSTLTSPTSHRRDILDDPTEDELPPAYTPNADFRSGETTVEYGPARPFQPAPPRPNQQNQYLRPNATGSSSFSSSYSGNGRRGGSLLSQLANQLQDLTLRAVSPHPTGSSSSYPPPSHPPPASSAGYPGQQHRIYAPPPGPPPPPRPSSQSTNSITPPEGATSDFARDFYAAGGDVNVEGAIPSESTGGAASNASGAGGAGGGGVVAPGKPTTTPTPGHPYLHDNMLLVYPKGFECDKCHNIGYKLPGLKPCKKCWPKYGKPFTGPLAYSFGESTSSSENFQRPLPPPSPSPVSRPPNNYPGTAGGSSHYASSHHPSTAYPPPAPSWNSGPGLGSGLGGHGNPTWGNGALGRMQTRVYGRPPPGSIVYSAGDMRLGGKRCWRCDGDGTISFMLFDREQCPVCGGIGRTY